MKFNLSHIELKVAEKSVYSQAGQDGVLEAVFNQIGEGCETAVEFGAGDGYHLSNTAYLKDKGWVRVLMDIEPKADFVFKRNINADNVNEIFKDIPKRIDYLSIDIDGNEYWIWQALENKPRIVSIEYNSKFKNTESFSIEYNPDHKWEGDDYYGASLLALKKLGEQKGYTLVYIVSELDAIFVRSDLIEEGYVAPTLDELLPEPIIAHPIVSNKKWVEV